MNMRWMKWLVFFVWVIAVALITWRMWARNASAADYRAARDLPRNHRIVAADLRPSPQNGSPLVGKYVGSAFIPKGAAVWPHALTAYPAMSPAPGKTPYFLQLHPEWNMQDALNAGSVVDVWAGQTRIVQSAKVLAVVSEQRGTTINYFAVLEVAAAEATQLDKDTAGPRILIRDFDSGGKDGNRQSTGDHSAGMEPVGAGRSR